MNTQHENIIVDSCQYTPVYLVQNTGAIQARPYIVTQTNVEETKPVSDNLKRFYESSGILENNFVNNAPSVTKPRILKKQDSKVVGNNLKLASFLLPKVSQENNLNKQCLPVNNLVLKPVASGNVINGIPKMEVVSADVVNNAPKVEIVTTNIENNPPQYELITTNVMNNAPKVELMAANLVNQPPQVEILPATVVSNASKVELVTTNVVNCSTVPKVEVDRKIVKLTNFPNALRTPPRINKHNRPRDDIPLFSSSNPHKKHTSVKLLKLGETYHSLSQLNESQMKMVNQALKIFSNPEKASTEPTYDPVTNTRFFYKVVSPRDLVEQNKLKKEDLITNKKVLKKLREHPESATPESIKPEQTKPEQINPEQMKPEQNKPIQLKTTQMRKKKRKEIIITKELQEKITRSGRKVKFPKQIDMSLPNPKKKSVLNSNVSCFQCSHEFPSQYRLQKHYDSHPTHLPAKVHSNLFHCLLASVKSATEQDRTNTFVEQLERLVERLKAVLPCLLTEIDGHEGQPCKISTNICWLLGVNPGKYFLNMEALSCVKDEHGKCRHNMKFNTNIDEPTPIWPAEHVNGIASTDVITPDCARINVVDARPIAKKRINKNKQQKNLNVDIGAKKKKMNPENLEEGKELEDIVNFGSPKQTTLKSDNKPTITMNSNHSEVVLELEDFLDFGLPKQNILKPENKPKKIIKESENTDLVFEFEDFINMDSPKQKSIKTETKKKKRMNKETIKADMDFDELVNFGSPKQKCSISGINNKSRISSENTEADIDFEGFDFGSPKQTIVDKIPEKTMLTSETTEPIIKLIDLVNFASPSNQNQIRITPKSLSLIDNIDVLSEDCIQPVVNGKQITTNGHSKEVESASTQFKSNLPNNQCAINIQPEALSLLDSIEMLSDNCRQTENAGTFKGPPKRAKGAHTQFHSTHFDIRSSPIKSSSAAIFRKFQINPENLGKFEDQIIRPLDLDSTPGESQKQESAIKTQKQTRPDPEPEPDEDPDDLHNIFRDDIMALTCKDPNDIPNDLAFEATKEWICSGLNEIMDKSHDSFMKTNSLDESFIKENSLIEPALLHLKEDSVDKLCNNPISSELTANNHLAENDDDRLISSRSSSVLNFLDSLASECLSYPETDIRNNAVDFQLDLFSFSNT